MRKKLLAAVLAVVMVIGAVPVVAFGASGSCGKHVAWTWDIDGTLTISGTGDMTDYDSPGSVPWILYSFGVKAVVIKYGVTSIGEYAFYKCDSLKDVNYNGTQAQWDAINIGKNNNPLLDAYIHVIIPEHEKYSITVRTDAGGIAKVSAAEAEEGTKITVTATPSADMSLTR